jgi:hypothetical protein
MSTRIHTKIAKTIAATLVIAAVVAPGTSAARPSKGTQITIPQSLARLQEPGSTGYVPKTTQVTTTGTAPQMRALILRAQALNRLYGNAWTRTSPAEFTSLVKAFGASVTTAMSLQQARAELARGQGLTRLTNLYEPGSGSSDYVPKTTLVTTTTPVGVGLDWISALIGTGAGLGIAVAGAGALMALRKRRTLAHV